MLEEFTELSKRLTPRQKGEPPPLTEKEFEVLRAIVEGLPNAEIARVLDIRLSTVKSHINHLFQKIKVSDRTQAILWAARQGLLLKRILKR